MHKGYWHYDHWTKGECMTGPKGSTVEQLHETSCYQSEKFKDQEHKGNYTCPYYQHESDEDLVAKLTKDDSYFNVLIKNSCLLNAIYVSIICVEIIENI